MGMNEKKRRARRTWIPAGAALAAGLGLFAFAAGHGRQGPPPQKDMAIDAATRTEVIQAAVAALDRSYVFADKAAAMHLALLRQLQKGDFDRATSAARFAEVLTDTLRRLSGDAHLEVRYVAQATPEGTVDATAEQARERTEQLRFNYGVADVQRLHGNLGYIDLHQFGRPDGAEPRIAAAMNLVRDTQALVVDLRRCGGGDPETVMTFASYLFDRPTHLNDIYWREENRTEVRWTRTTLAGPAYGAARSVYLLVGPDTFSGCEDLAYALKNARRAILVGEQTGGGAHAGDPHRLNPHFDMFVPAGRPINPVTHADWEGVGVAPDVSVSARKAMDIAQALALRTLIAREPDPDWKQRLQERLDELD